ncbi:MAG TPA: hypothetical protein VEI07_26050 [Planctomycetaceae bacterium]|nr:hypothetical protein [Planctomycetaceae bacterium]
MKSKNSDVPHSTRFATAAVAVALVGCGLFVAGCGSKPGQSLDDQLREMKTSRQRTGKFAGTVTIDGLPPREAVKDGVRIMLYDPKNPPAENSVPLNAVVDFKDGSFEFTTYSQGDGVPVGKYIVLFVALKHSLLGRQQGYHEPDALKNLYNDPDKNEQNPQFNVEVTEPGSSDHQFNLALEGKMPGTPGPKSITRFN